MLSNYLKIAIRNLRKNKLYTAINILGLTVGVTCFMLIALFIQYETSYDKDHEKASQIYRVGMIQKGNDFRGSDRFSVSPQPLAPALVEKFPEVENATTLDVSTGLLESETLVSNEEGLFADQNVFDVFTISVVKGIGKEALEDPSNILLTESLAKKFFQDTDPIGQSLKFRNDRFLTVSGIIEDISDKQHMAYDFVTSVKNLGYYESDIGRWNSNNYRTYALLQEGADIQKLQEKIKALDKIAASSYEGAPFVPEFFLQPLLDIHLNTSINFELKPSRARSYIYLFASIAFIILLLASINYMNLATANSAQRAKEVGMRKVLGAARKQLVFQFLSESFLITIISFLLAVELVHLLLPYFNELLDLPISFQLLNQYGLLIGMLFTAFLISVLSGLYPAAFLSGLSPIRAFRGSFLKSYKKGASLRNVLMIGQFATAIVLAIGSIVIFQQLQYIQNKKLGFNRDQVVYMNYRGEGIYEKTDLIREQLQKIPNVEKVSFTRYMPLNMNSQGIVNTWEGNHTEEELYIYRNYVDHNFLEVFEMELLEGQALSIHHAQDTVAKYLLNESAVQALGWEDPVGKEFWKGRVIGVVKDFHFQPFNLSIEPMFLSYRRAQDSYSNNIALKVQMEEIDQTLVAIEQTMKNILPQMPFEYRFMDESFNRLYESESRLGKAFNILTILSLFIACMGLFGLVSLHVQKRTKEIGIRKVLGATKLNIVNMLSKDFVRLTAVAILIAAPIAWYVMQQWLQNFVYHVELKWWVFLLAGSGAIAIAFLTVSFQSIKAALENPVENLRNE